MFFGKKRRIEVPEGEKRSVGEGIAPEIFRVLESLEKAGTQLVVRFSRNDGFTSSILGLGREDFYIDTLSPPSGDRRAKPGALVEVESLLDGERYHFKTTVTGKVEFLDELPAFKLRYPDELIHEQRRKTKRLSSKSTAWVSFLRPFACDAVVTDIGSGGLGFEYPAEQGRLPVGMRLGGVKLDMGIYGIIEVRGEIVVTLVASLGGLSLPASYRTGMRFTSIGDAERAKLDEYLKSLET